MANAIELSTAVKNRDAWVAASEAVATGKSYKIGQRALTRADVAEIIRMIDYWQALVDRLSRVGAGMRCRQVVPLDN